MEDNISTENIQSLLPAGHPWRSMVHCCKVLDSTNNALKEMAKSGAPEGTILIADHQTGGRGRMGRSFLSPSGVGIYFSLLLRPHCPPDALMHLTCASAEAMCTAIEQSVGVRPGIKWTNDLVFNRRKLCGILTELSLQSDGSIDYAVIGIGLNCHQTVSDFPEELQATAGSLDMVSGHITHRNRIIAKMIDALYQMNHSLLSEADKIMTGYRSDCITLGQEISIARGDIIEHGTALDVNSDGSLVVLLHSGDIKIVSSGEVSIRGMYGYV